MKLPDPPEVQPSTTYQVPCEHCPRVLDVEGFILAAHPTAGEKYAFVAQVADAKEWGHGYGWFDGQLKAIFVCPACIAKKTSPEAMARVLPKFDAIGRCGACGHEEVDVRHCHGRLSSCELGAPRNHLHRTCKRCGWSWIEGRLDEGKSA